MPLLGRNIISCPERVVELESELAARTYSAQLRQEAQAPIGSHELLGRVGSSERNGPHSGSPGRVEARWGILHDYAVLRPDIKARCGSEVTLGIGLAMIKVLGRDQNQRLRQIRVSQSQGGNRPEACGDDRPGCRRK